jgi:hypothetical protein
MKRGNMKADKMLVLLFALLAVGCATLGAQATGTLTVQCNVAGSQVYLNDELVGGANPNYTHQFPVNNYTLRVSHKGYQDFVATITLTPAGLLVQANLYLPGQAPVASSPQPQPSAPPVNGRYTLTVTSDVPTAAVLINGALVGRPPFTGQYPPGKYTIIVRRGGYPDYTQTIQLSGNTQINAILGSGQPTPPPPPPQPMPVQSSLTVNANIQGAQVYLNGNPVGQAPLTVQLVPGSYAVLVRSPGYADFNQNIVVNGPTQVNAMLTGLSFPLSIDSGAILGAQVFINGSPIGQTPLQTALPGGIYNLTVRMPGFLDYSNQLTLNGPQNVSASLVPMMATWQVSLPDSIINRDLRGAHWNEIHIFIDGAPQQGYSGQVGPGQHRLRLVAGGLATEVVFNAQAGQAYRFEPFLGINVR